MKPALVAFKGMWFCCRVRKAPVKKKVELISASVDRFNHWFMRFAPKAYRDTRVKTAAEVEAGLRVTKDLRSLAPAVLRQYPNVLPTLRMATCPPLARDRLIGLAGANKHLVKTMEEGKRLWSYLESGRERGIHGRYLPSSRSPWYSQEHRPPAPFLCTYMGRRRENPFRFIWNKSQATAANVYLLLYPRAPLSDALQANRELYQKVFHALQSISAESFLGEGRVYGGGLFKMEPKELARLPAEPVLDAIGAVGMSQQRLLSDSHRIGFSRAGKATDACPPSHR